VSDRFTLWPLWKEPPITNWVAGEWTQSPSAYCGVKVSISYPAMNRTPILRSTWPYPRLSSASSAMVSSSTWEYFQWELFPWHLMTPNGQFHDPASLPRRNSSKFSTYRRLGGHQNRSASCRVESNRLFLSGIESRFLCCLSRSVDVIAGERSALYWCLIAIKNILWGTR
jgi:hypothetical protein